MQVNGILNQLSNAASLGKRSDTAAGAGAASTGAAAAPPTLGTSAAVRAIIAQYNITDISANEFSQMIQKLYAAGGISQKDLQNLSGVRADLVSAGVDPDESLNLQDFYAQKISATQNKADTTGGASQPQDNSSPIMQRMGWLEKFQAIKSQPDGANLSALA